MAFGDVTEDNVYTCVGHPLGTDIQNMVTWMLNEPFSVAYKNILDLRTLKGLALQDIVTEVHNYVHKVDLPEKVLVHLVIKLAELEERLMKGTNEKIQLGSLVSAFQITRDMIKEEAKATA